jgi:uncharacterized membrane protein (UPF0127 family)
VLKTTCKKIMCLSAAAACMILWAAPGCDKKTEQNTGGKDETTAKPIKIPTEPMELGGQDFVMELAYTQQARQLGLMFRSELAADRGMIFIFERPAQQSFYMKNCLIDLDLLFLDEQGRITTIHTMRAPKASEPLQFYRSSGPVKYAIELPAGTAARLKLCTGQTVTLPERVRQILAEPD